MTEGFPRRCAWAGGDALNIAYHDREWGRPVHDEHKLFEMLTLEGAQAGLSWLTILRKRDGYRRAFAGFDPQRVAGFDRAIINRLCLDSDIVRHRGKIESTVSNARRITALWERGNSLSEIAWSIVNGEPKINHWGCSAELPASTPESTTLSKQLKQLGFRFVGPTTCYAFMQAAGMVNDHETACFRHPRHQARMKD